MQGTEKIKEEPEAGDKLHIQLAVPSMLSSLTCNVHPAEESP